MKEKVITDNTVEKIETKYDKVRFSLISEAKIKGEGKQPLGYSVTVLNCEEAQLVLKDLADFINGVLNGK